ncbi:MAG: methionyl-tRNA formyltransferase [Ruminococcus sp.]|nr:methionyl-tRNA formyltransferase [Ruminococcus sp.]
MKLVYMGTPDFAVPALEKLAAVHEVAAVFTQPDKPVGRKQILTPPDVKVCAERLGIPVCQPASMKTPEAFELLKSFAPEVIVVAAYGQILPKAVLDLPAYGCVNIHGSLLPKYRGAAPIQQAVLNGDAVTGVTTMLMDVGLDTGDILLTKETPIGENETSAELFDRLSLLGGELILETLDALAQGSVTPKKQDEALATHTSKIDKSLCPIDFTATAQAVHNLIRGLYSWPVATAQIGGKRVKIHKSRIAKGSGSAGVILSVKPFVIACGEGAVEILELQPEGKKKMSAEAFAAGHDLKIGDKLI